MRQILSNIGNSKTLLYSLGVVLMSFLVSTGGQAQLIKDFKIQYQAQQKGSIVFISNSSVTCGTCSASVTSSQMPPAGGNNSSSPITSAYVDIDGDPSTSMSSSDSLNLPNCSEISWAGLYWGGEIGGVTAAEKLRRDSVKLKVNNGIYVNLKADTLWDNTVGAFTTFHCYKNITSTLQSNGIKARYTIANLITKTGVVNKFGGWTIVVVYKNDLMDMRNLTVFQGLVNVASGAGTNSLDIPISGFLTPPAPSAVKFELGIVAYDGDRGSTGDQLLFKGQNQTTPGYYQIFNTLNPVSDIFNSTITYNDALTPFRLPNLNNTLGYDADIFIPDNTTYKYIGNNATFDTIRQTTSSETYLTQVVSCAIDVYEPDMRVVNSVKDLNGGLVVAGDTLEYTLIAKNQGSDISLNTIVYDTLNFNLDFVPGSLNVIKGPNIGPKSDGADGDQAEYNPATRVVLFRVGTGANNTTGGQVINSFSGIDSTVVKFRATATAECVKLMCDPSVPNRAYMKGVGQISGNYLVGGSNPDAVDAFGCPIKGSTTTNLQVGTCTATISSSNTPSCVGDTIKLYTSYATNAIYSWTGPNGFTSNVQNPVIPNVTAAMAGTYNVSIGFSGVMCTQTASANVVVTVGGTTTYTGGILCNPVNSGTITLSGQIGSVVKWQTSTTGGVSWSDIANTTASLSFSNAVNNQQYRAVVNGGVGSCAVNSSASTITVTTPSVGGTTSYSGMSPLCTKINSGTVTLSGYTGTIVKWQSSITGGTSWTDILNTTTTHNFYNALNNQQFRAVVNNGTSCLDANSVAAIISATAAACIEICTDGIDNDGDGLIDCEDPDCGIKASPLIKK
jgi:uncharacterized repeat protein (TIGR01451 family)